MEPFPGKGLKEALKKAPAIRGSVLFERQQERDLAFMEGARHPSPLLF